MRTRREPNRKKPQDLTANDSSPLVVTVRSGRGRGERIVVKDTHEIVRLDGRAYHTYRIVQPEGFLDEDIFHRRDRGPEALMALVFTALAEAPRPRPARAGRA